MASSISSLVGANAVLIAQVNPRAQYVTNVGSVTVYVDASASVNTSSYPLNPGASITWAAKSELWALCPTGTTTVVVSGTVSSLVDPAAIASSITVAGAGTSNIARSLFSASGAAAAFAWNYVPSAADNITQYSSLIIEELVTFASSAAGTNYSSITVGDEGKYQTDIAGTVARTKIVVPVNRLTYGTATSSPNLSWSSKITSSYSGRVSPATYSINIAGSTAPLQPLFFVDDDSQFGASANWPGTYAPTPEATINPRTHDRFRRFITLSAGAWGIPTMEGDVTLTAYGTSAFTVSPIERRTGDPIGATITGTAAGAGNVPAVSLRFRHPRVPCSLYVTGVGTINGNLTWEK